MFRAMPGIEKGFSDTKRTLYEKKSDRLCEKKL